jgi:hypothetical protein
MAEAKSAAKTAAKSVAQKLQVKPGDTVSIVGGSAEERALIGELPEASAEVSVEDAAVAVTFLRSRDELLAAYASELPLLGGAKAVWFVYPKGGRADVNRDVIMREAGAFGWRAISNVAVSDTWSAVRVRPLADGEAPLG